MKKIPVLAFGLLLIISFQNCSQHRVSPSTEILATAGVNAHQIPASDYEQLVLWSPEKQIYLDVNSDTGRMLAYQQNGESKGEAYCLSLDESQELVAILNGAEICQPPVDQKLNKDRVCTMIYKFPYASIVKDRTEFRLGEMNSGCDQPVDLCGDRALMLKNFTVAIMQSLGQRLCK